MNLLLVNALVWHVISGVLATVAFAGLTLLLRGEDLSLRWLKVFSLMGLVGFLISWLSGGYYYSTYYGGFVKPKIISSSYQWVHEVVMESKEHVFLLLPFLAFIVFIFLFFWQKELRASKGLKLSLLILCFFIVSMGMLMSLSGIAISGSVPK